MTEQDKKIYEVIADKTLSFGCKVILKDYLGVKIINHSIGNLTFIFGYEYPFNPIKDINKIIGHPVMPGNVINYMKTNKPVINNSDQKEIQNLVLDLLDNWDDLTKPIEEQSQECKDYISNLIEEYEKTD